MTGRRFRPDARALAPALLAVLILLNRLQKTPSRSSSA